MNTVKDYNIFNSVNPNALNPTVKKHMPFPLENFDEEIGIVYEQMNRIIAKLNAAEQNPVNKTPAKKRRLKSLKYKAVTCTKLIKDISTSCSEL